MYTLGLNAAFHDPAACLVCDGVVVAAAEEERFTRIKHGKRPLPFSTWELPFNAVDYVLREGGIGLADVDHVAYSFDPWLLLGDHSDGHITLPLEPSAHPVPEEWEAAWDPLFVASIVNAPRHLASGAPLHLAARFRGARPDGPYQWHFVPHHLAHVASAYLPSPFDAAAVLTLDGRGEQATTAYAVGEGSDLRLLGEVRMPHSLGLLYEDVTAHLGYLRSSDEYKVMALASFGRPSYREAFRDILTVEDGRVSVADYAAADLLGPPRERGGPLEQRHYDVARSLQEALEDGSLELARWLRRETGKDDLCMAGGVALNCVMNSRIAHEGPFRRVWVQPAAGDAGTALGAALWVDLRERGRAVGAAAEDDDGRAGRAPPPPAGARAWRMDHAYLGPGFSEQQIEDFLRWSKLTYRRMDDVAADVARVLARDRVIGWFQGRMEFGPRALGARSILASPLHEEMRDRLNDLKDREDYRPVAPIVTEEAAPAWFTGAGESPFMLFVFDVEPGKAESIPAVRHVDGTARIQTVRRQQNPLVHRLLEEFGHLTGVPVLVNTSFNTRGEPIVCTPRDAVESFWSSPLDALAIGPFLVEKAGR